MREVTEVRGERNNVSREERGRERDKKSDER